MPPIKRTPIGEMRHRIQIFTGSTTQDSFGGVSPDVGTLLATTWARVITPQGRALYDAQQKVSLVTHKITMRWASGITVKQYVLFNGKYLTIESVNDPDGQRIYLELLCVERNDSTTLTGGSAQ